MSEVSKSFVRRSASGRFFIDWEKVPAESLFATERLLREIVPHLRKARGVVLDIGCGSKPYGIVFQDQVVRHIGIDMPITGFGYNRIDAFSTAMALPFRSESFDFVLCTEVLEHVPDPFTAYREIARVLKRGGSAIITTPFMYRVHEAPYDFFRYTPFAHRELARRAGLQIQSIDTRGGLLTVAADLMFKFAATLTGGLSSLLSKVLGTRMRLIERKWVKFGFMLFQRPPAALLMKENLKSDIYTIGYVVMLVKA